MNAMSLRVDVQPQHEMERRAAQRNQVATAAGNKPKRRWRHDSDTLAHHEAAIRQRTVHEQRLCAVGCANEQVVSRPGKRVDISFVNVNFLKPAKTGLWLIRSVHIAQPASRVAPARDQSLRSQRRRRTLKAPRACRPAALVASAAM